MSFYNPLISTLFEIKVKIIFCGVSKGVGNDDYDTE